MRLNEQLRKIELKSVMLGSSASKPSIVQALKNSQIDCCRFDIAGNNIIMSVYINKDRDEIEIPSFVDKLLIDTRLKIYNLDIILHNLKTKVEAVDNNSGNSAFAKAKVRILYTGQDNNLFNGSLFGLNILRQTPKFVIDYSNCLFETPELVDSGSGVVQLMGYLSTDKADVVKLPKVKSTSSLDALNIITRDIPVKDIIFNETYIGDDVESFNIGMIECDNLKSIDLSNIRTNSLKAIEFERCSSLEEIKFGENIKTDLTSIANMCFRTTFYNCRSLKVIDFGNFELRGVIDKHHFSDKTFDGTENLRLIRFNSTTRETYDFIKKLLEIREDRSNYKRVALEWNHII